MRGKRRFTTAQLEAALRAQGGVQAAAARALAEAIGEPVNRQTISEAVKRSPRLQRVCTEAEELNLDLAENVVLLAIQARDLGAAKFLLETRGKHRGYSRRQEITGAAGEPIEVNDARGQLYDELDQMAARRRSVAGGPDGAARPNGAGPPVEEVAPHPRRADA